MCACARAPGLPVLPERKCEKAPISVWARIPGCLRARTPVTGSLEAAALRRRAQGASAWICLRLRRLCQCRASTAIIAVQAPGRICISRNGAGRGAGCLRPRRTDCGLARRRVVHSARRVCSRSVHSCADAGGYAWIVAGRASPPMLGRRFPRTPGGEGCRLASSDSEEPDAIRLARGGCNCA